MDCYIFRRMKLCLLVLTAFLLLGTRPAPAQDPLPEDHNAAVIFAYQMIGEDDSPAASIRTEQFAAHVRELREGGYNIQPLGTIVQAVRNDTGLPPFSVALTFDGGHRSVLDRAVPLLLEKQIPFTLFIATELLDSNDPSYMNWEDLKKLSRNELVTIGVHPASYKSLGNAGEEEIRRQINSARARLREMTGIEARYFAYPFGEYSLRYRNILASMTFDAAFGQQSSVAYAGISLLSMPRFVMTEEFGNLSRFRMTAKALPLPVRYLEPRDPWLTASLSTIGFTANHGLESQLDKLSCFVSGQEKPAFEREGNRVKLHLADEIRQDKTRINCTMPGPPPQDDDEQRWRWFGLLLKLAPAAP